LSSKSEKGIDQASLFWKRIVINKSRKAGVIAGLFVWGTDESLVNGTLPC
jgi:hypothetical protein